MDIATIVGVLLGLGLIVGSIVMGGNAGGFLNGPGIMIVLGGTIAATLMMQRLSVVLGAIKVGMMVLFHRKNPPEELIKTIVKLSGIVKRDGLLALEKQKVKDAFLDKGVRLLSDGLELSDILAILRTELAYLKSRHKRGQKVFKFMAATAPAFGMIGTLIGLVQMLMKLDDPSMIGPAMAVALLTTLYGAILAFLIFGPIASKLENITVEETAHMDMVLSGIKCLATGVNPRIVEQNLVAYLDPKTRKSVVPAKKSKK